MKRILDISLSFYLHHSEARRNRSGTDSGQRSEEGEEDGAQLLLRDVVKPVFEDNDKAREVMKRLPVETLQVSEVRAVLQRRVEAFGSV